MIDNPRALERAATERQVRTGADWFFWIAGLSLISSLVVLAGKSYHPLLGLGTTQLIDASAKILHLGTGGKVVLFVLDLIAAGFYILYGAFARKGQKWAFVTGMAFYALDGLLMLALGILLGAAFHAYALWCIYRGFQAAQRLSLLPPDDIEQTLVDRSPSSQSGVWPPPPSAPQ